MVIPQGEYERIITLVPIVCVDVAIYYQGYVLLIRRADEPEKGEWWLPGGRLFKYEELSGCALRKAREEVGLDCKFVDIIHFDNTIFDTGPGDIPIHSVNFCALLTAETGQIALDASCLDYIWTDKPQSYVKHKYIEICLLKANSKGYYIDD